MLRMRGDEWQVGSRSLRLLRAGWLAGWLMLLVHVAAAFHVAHGWSHTAAYEHTERTSGVGEGIFVNYLFGVDMGSGRDLMGSPGSYARRPRWVGWMVHGFLTFVVFNATVVYGTGFIRWTGYSCLCYWGGTRSYARLSLSEFNTTDTELRLIAAAAHTGRDQPAAQRHQQPGRDRDRQHVVRERQHQVLPDRPHRRAAQVAGLGHRPQVGADQRHPGGADRRVRSRSPSRSPRPPPPAPGRR